MTKVCEICGKEFTVTNRNQGKKICSLACRTQKHRMATIRSDIKTALKELGLEAHGNQIATHYAHARKKHPYFCDMLLPPRSEWTKENAHGYLNEFRNSITAQMQTHRLLWSELCNCEIAEAEDALINGDTAHAVEECYDAIAVLLRTIDVLEGRQKLGKPETRGEAK